MTDKLNSGNGNETLRIGVYVCHCGTNIAKTVDVARVAEMSRSIPGVVVSRHYKVYVLGSGSGTDSEGHQRTQTQPHCRGCMQSFDA